MLTLSIGEQTMNNQTKYEWSISNEELEAMYQEQQEKNNALDERFGKYRKRYEFELRSLRERYQRALEHEELKLFDLYERKWKIMRGFPEFWGEGRAA